MLTQPDATISSIARLLGVSRSTIYKYLPELKPDGPVALEIPTARTELEPPPKKGSSNRPSGAIGVTRDRR